jgi:prepilin-type N-terminal cleavage/methylation domain-containing protein
MDIRNKITMNQRAFTLVEILVVIAVIGLLSSIIFAITRGADEQGRIARGLYFSQHLQNSLGSYAAGIWNFDEGAGTAANDISGWENDGTLINGPTWRCASVDSSYTPSSQGCSLEFNGSTQYVNTGNGASINPGAGDFTIEGWFWIKGYPAAYNVWLSNTTSGGLSSLIDTDRFSIGRSLVSENAIFYTTIPTNQWFHIAVTRTEGTAHGYYNGQFISSAAFNFTLNTGNVILGIDGNLSSFPYYGLIDEVRIYAASLTSVQIKSRYYAGLERLLTKGKITEQEYQQKLLTKL